MTVVHLAWQADHAHRVHDNCEKIAAIEIIDNPTTPLRPIWPSLTMQQVTAIDGAGDERRRA